MIVVNQPAIDKHAARLASLRVQLASAELHLDLLPRPSVTPDDPAYVNLKNHRGNLDADVDKGIAVEKAEEKVNSLTKSLEWAERNKPEPLTVEDIKGARAVRDRFMWQPVRRINTKTVTLESQYDVKVPFERIYGVKP